MKTKPAFQPLIRPGRGTCDPVAYTPIIFICGDTAHRLALHKDLQISLQWQVSDPKSGAKILDVSGALQGIRVSSRNFTLNDARQAAKARLHELVERIGSDKFNAVMANPKPF